MKLISWNVWELGGFEKRKEVRSIRLFLFLHETELQVCDDGFGASLWGNSLVSFSFRPSQGAP